MKKLIVWIKYTLMLVGFAGMIYTEPLFSFSMFIVFISINITKK